MTTSFSLPLVKMQALHKSYGSGAVQVLKGIDIEMKPGERVVVIGPPPSAGNTKPVRRRTNGFVVVPPSFGASAWTDAPSCSALSGGPGRLACDLPPLAPGRAFSPGLPSLRG